MKSLISSVKCTVLLALHLHVESVWKEKYEHQMSVNGGLREQLAKFTKQLEELKLNNGEPHVCKSGRRLRQTASICMHKSLHAHMRMTAYMQCLLVHI